MPPDARLKLSVVIIAQDEAEDLPACLQSVRGLADEVVVVDGGSKDATAALARDAGARVLHRPFDGFAPQKQAALDAAAGPWVLSLDADERLSDGLREEVRALLAGPVPPHRGYRLPRRVEYLGRRLRFSGVGGETVLRLFRKDAGRFVGGLVHEHVEVDGSVGTLRKPLWHRPFRDLGEHLAKLARYSELGAEKRALKGARPRPWDHLALPLVFAERYVLKGGFLDGGAGFVWCAFAGLNAWLKRVRLRERAGAER